MPGRTGWRPLAPSTSVLLVEQVHDLLQILRREPRVDRCRLDVGVTEMLLHRAQVAAGTLEQLDAAQTTLSARQAVTSQSVAIRSTGTIGSEEFWSGGSVTKGTGIATEQLGLIHVRTSRRGASEAGGCGGMIGVPKVDSMQAAPDGTVSP